MVPLAGHDSLDRNNKWPVSPSVHCMAQPIGTQKMVSNIQIGCNYLFHLIDEVRQVNKETCPLVAGVVEEAGQLGQEG